MSTPAPSRRLRWSLRLAAVAVVVAGVVWMLRTIDLAALEHALAAARVWPIVVAAAINFGLIACKAIAWRILLGAANPVPLSRLVSYTITACAVSVILPLRSGELVRLWLLRDRDGVPIAYSTAVAAAEKLVDVIALLALVAPLPWIVDDLPSSIGYWILGLSIGVLAVLAGLRVIAPRLDRTSWIGRFGTAFAVVHRPRVLVSTIAILFASWLVDLAMVTAVFWAIGIDVPIAVGILVLFSVNVSIALPSTPASVGALELGAVLGLRLAGVPDEQSLAFALVYHAAQVIPIVLVAFVLNGRSLHRTFIFDRTRK